MQGTEEAGGGPERRLLSSLRWATFALFALAGMALLVHSPPGMLYSPNELTRYFAVKQDIPVLVAMILFFAQFNSPARLVGHARALVLRNWQVVAILFALTALTWCLRTQVLFDYDMSRDEKMATFDTAILSGGQLFQPIPAFWQDYYRALNTNFILPIGDREGWASTYLPVNAALRALLGKVMASDLVSPLLVLVSGLVLWRIAARIWPDSRSTQTVVVVLFAASSQVVLTGTTTYAMTLHLAMNLIWLWLFLQRKPLAHAGAIATGFFATGIHQPLFHPLFVLPFLDLLRRERQWKTLAAYVVCYGAIGLFWLAWPSWLSAQGAHPVPAAMDVEGVGYLKRFLRTVGIPSFISFTLMGANLLRFFAWQHLLLLPLAVVALRSDERRDPLCRALWQGIVLLVAVMTVLLPLQVHGWGYRYLHGFIGSAVLVAGYGWHRLERDGLAPLRAMRWATAITALVIFPVHVWMARTLIAPYAATSAWINSIPTDLVVVDDVMVAFSFDLVLNRADLSNRPVLLSGGMLQAGDMAGLCRNHTVAFVDSDMISALDHVFGQSSPGGPSEHQLGLEAAARAAQCTLVPVTR